MSVLPTSRRYGVERGRAIDRDILEEPDVKVALHNAADLLCSSIASRHLPDDASDFRLAELEAHVLDTIQNAVLGITVEGL